MVEIAQSIGLEGTKQVRKPALMAVSAPHWIRRAVPHSMGLNSRTPFSLQNAIRIAAKNALDGTGALGKSNWADKKSLRESVTLMNYWIDQRADYEKMLRRIRPNVLFLGAMTPSFPGAIEVAKSAKEILNEDVFILLGGKHVNETLFEDKQGTMHHAKDSPVRLMQEGKIPDVFDMVCAGRCEDMIAHIAERICSLLMEGTSSREIYEEMDRIAKKAKGDWRAGWIMDGVRHTVRSLKIPLDTNELPIPAEIFGIEDRFDIFDTKLTAHAFSDTSAGCVFDCFFCSERSTVNGRPHKPNTAADRLFRQFKAIKHTACTEHTTASISAFVEDSTLLGTGKKPDQLLQLATLMKKEDFSMPFGGQFTVDQLLDTEIQQAIIELRSVGLSYVFCGMETADESVAGTMSKNVHKKESWIKRNERVIAFLKHAELQYGVAVLFGLGENQEKRISQLNQIKQWQDTYCLPSVVSLNLATKHPLQQDDGSEEDFTAWGVTVDSPYIEVFQRVFSESSVQHALYPALLPTIEELLEIEHLYKRLTLKQKPYETVVQESNDFYFDDELYQRYTEGRMSALHFNSACVGMPSAAVRAISTNIAKREDELTDEEKEIILRNARTRAASLVNLSDERGVVLTRNTTEAASFVYWLAGLQSGDHVLLTDAENTSIKRLFEQHIDHGNPKREDYWSAWTRHYSARGATYPDFQPSYTGVETTTVHVLAATDEEIESNIRSCINAKTKVLTFSHVLRNTGREMNVQTLCELARAVKAKKNPEDPDIFIFVDGAQALGNLPSVDFATLGCDAYVATPHKTMGSEVIGLLYFDTENPRIHHRLEALRTLDPLHQQVILDGMFDERLGITANVDDNLSYGDIAGFSAAIDDLHASGLRGNNFSALHEHRSTLKAYCKRELQTLSTELGIDIVIPEIGPATSFILSIHIPSKDGKRIAKQLAKKGVFLSYIHGQTDSDLSKILRISFRHNQSPEEIDMLINSLREILNQ